MIFILDRLTPMQIRSSRRGEEADGCSQSVRELMREQLDDSLKGKRMCAEPSRRASLQLDYALPRDRDATGKSWKGSERFREWA